MLLYFAIALIGVVMLAGTFVLGEIFDFLNTDGLDGDTHPLSGKVIAVVMTTFGAVGMLVTAYDWGTFLGALTSGLSSVVMGALTWWLLVLIDRETGSTDTSVGDLRGRMAQVSITIQAGSVGEVVLRGAESTRHLLASSRDGSPIPAGTAVRVVDAVGGTVVVERAMHEQVGAAQVAKAEE